MGFRTDDTFPRRDGRAPDHEAKARTIRVMLLSDIRLYREGLTSVLAGVDGISVVAVAADRASAVRAAAEHEPDVVVVDAAMATAPDVVRELASATSAGLVALDVPATEEAMVEYAGAGVVGYASRDGSLDDVVRTIRAACTGHVSCEPILVATLVSAVRSSAVATNGPKRRGVSATTANLTERERQIARLIAFEGLSNKEIAERLFIELPTVKNHVHNVLTKLGVSRRCQAAVTLRAEEPVRTI